MHEAFWNGLSGVRWEEALLGTRRLRERGYAGRTCRDYGLLAATVFAHESAAFGVHVLAGAGVDVRLSCRVGSGCAEEAGERGDGFEEQGVECGPAGRRRGGRGTRRWRGGARPGRRAGGPGRPRRGS